jgi:nucleoside-diphosphate-sugar epimerase
MTPSTNFYLVTGATGFIGRHVVGQLLSEGKRVRVLVRNRSRIPGAWQDRVDAVEGDITSPPSLIPAVRDVNVILHLAGVINLPPGEEDTFYRVNLEGTKQLFQAVVRTGMSLERFLFCGSVGVMGFLREIPANEETPCFPTNAYERSKLEAEHWILEEGRRQGIPVSVARPAWVYGPGDRRTLPIFSMIARRRFVMIGKGETWIHPVYVEDLAKGILRCARSGEAVGRCVILAGEAPIRLKELVHLIADAAETRLLPVRLPVFVAFAIALGCEILYKPLRKQPPIHRRRLGFFLRDQSFDISLARRYCGYVPETPLREGIRRTVAWYRSHGWL